MKKIDKLEKLKFEAVPVDPFWNTDNCKELRMHHIHSYPAKFPAFITTKALAFASKKGLKVKNVADIFCGCGTVALESKRANLDFWGCDINPVATLIAEVKSSSYEVPVLLSLKEEISNSFYKAGKKKIELSKVNERIKYWYSSSQTQDLARLKEAIEITHFPSQKYKNFFLCAFSNILKPSSRWLTKSIKPQIDPNKKPKKVAELFEEQCRQMIIASDEFPKKSTSKTKIVTSNFLDLKLQKPKVDMIITSPPYVTSYEYADLHQLSTLWLDFASDYRELRRGSVGSLHHEVNFDKDVKKLNLVGSGVTFRLYGRDRLQAKSVSKYYMDMQEVASSCFSMLNKNGLAVFVIGDTVYKGVKIENARHLCHSLKDAGFKSLFISKRKISKKILTPYRDKVGRFSRTEGHQKIYSEEYIIIGKK